MGSLSPGGATSGSRGPASPGVFVCGWRRCVCVAGGGVCVAGGGVFVWLEEVSACGWRRCVSVAGGGECLEVCVCVWRRCVSVAVGGVRVWLEESYFYFFALVKQVN